MIEEGQTLGRYELQQFIGKGGMADVYRGYDIQSNRLVAVKIFKRQDEELLRRFVREAHLMAALKHPHLMPIYSAGEARLNGVTQYYIAMPYMEGGTLRGRIRHAPLSLADACRVVSSIADALDYIHSRGIIHRDIKSSNVLIDRRGLCYLSDFGIARATAETTQLTQTGNVLGTVDYVAPELFEPHYKADARSDLYSLGILLYEVVTGNFPFVADSQIALVAMHVSKLPPSPRAFLPTIPPQVERVMLRALEKKPELRYESAGEFAEAFCSAVAQADRGPSVAPVRQFQDEDEATVPDPSLYDQPYRSVPLPSARPVSPARSREAESYQAQGRTQRESHPSQPPQPPRSGSRSLSSSRSRMRSPRRRKGHPVIITVLALLTLAAIIVPIAYVILHMPNPKGGPGLPGGASTAISSPDGQNTTDTGQSNAATATRQAVDATAAAHAAATATARAQASATAGVIQTATTGNPAYQDTLNNASNPITQAAQWDQTSHCVFQQDGYHITEGTNLFGGASLRGCLEQGKQYSDAAFSVDISVLSGHSGGIFFRVGKKALGAYSGYLFEVDSKGNYKISSSANFSTGASTTILQDWTASSALHTGAQKNTLQVLARKNTLLFYANGTFLFSLRDDTFTLGYLALVATTSYNGANAEIVYSNLKVFPVA